jgi:hypothetical protein
MKKKQVWIKNYLQMKGDRFAVIYAQKELTEPQMQKAVEDYLIEQHKEVDERFLRSDGVVIRYKEK